MCSPSFPDGLKSDQSLRADSAKVVSPVRRTDRDLSQGGLPEIKTGGDRASHDFGVRPLNRDDVAGCDGMLR